MFRVLFYILPNQLYFFVFAPFSIFTHLCSSLNIFFYGISSICGTKSVECNVKRTLYGFIYIAWVSLLAHTVQLAVHALCPDLATKTLLQWLPFYRLVVYVVSLVALPPEVIYARLYVSHDVNFKSLEPLGSIVA